MTRFTDQINRLFDELVHDPWRQPSRGLPPLRPAPLGVTWEFDVPIRGAGHDDIAFSTEGRQLIVAVRHRATESDTYRTASLTRDAEEHFRQSFTLPEGTELASVEARFEDQVLRIRVMLRTQQVRE